MKSAVALFLALVLLFACFAFADQNMSAYEYLTSHGYNLQWYDDSPGWPSCHFMGMNDGYGISISDESDAWILMALPEYAPDFDLSEFQELFVYLVESFVWEVSCYWENHDESSIATLSYGVTEDPERTEMNYLNLHDYIDALKEEFGIAQSAIISGLNPLALSSYIRLIESVIGCDLFSANSENADIQAFINETRADVIAHYDSLGFKRDSITSFMENHFCMPITASPIPSIGKNVCAEYLFHTGYAACRTGTDNENMLLYSYSADGSAVTVSNTDLWRFFELLKEYISANKSSIILDGLSHGADSMAVVIDILTSDGYIRAVYDLITDECTLTTL